MIASSFTVMASEDVDFSVSLKTWSGTLNDDRGKSDEAFGSVLTGTAKRGNYFVSVSTLIPTTYVFSDGSYDTRRDNDVTAGYSLNNNISLLAGIKKINIISSDGNGSLTPKYFGINGFSSIGENSFIYGTATRSLKAKSSRGYSYTYQSYEAGYGYLLNKSTQISAGYRVQLAKFDNTVKVPGLIFGVSLNF